MTTPCSLVLVNSMVVAGAGPQTAYAIQPTSNALVASIAWQFQDNSDPNCNADDTAIMCVCRVGVLRSLHHGTPGSPSPAQGLATWCNLWI